jgi:CHAT domain-containing protein
MIGMSWAFLVAGSPATVVSQWQADSRATTLLMTAFHRNLASGKSVAQSLRQASLELRQNADYAHPFYWAGFEAIGKADRGAPPAPASKVSAR